MTWSGPLIQPSLFILALCLPAAPKIYDRPSWHNPHIRPGPHRHPQRRRKKMDGTYKQGWQIGEPETDPEVSLHIWGISARKGGRRGGQWGRARRERRGRRQRKLPLKMKRRCGKENQMIPTSFSAQLADIFPLCPQLNAFLWSAEQNPQKMNSSNTVDASLLIKLAY